MLFRSVAEYLASGFKPQVFIVGSGPAGMTLALRLQERKVPCLLIEAGGYDYSVESQEFYKGDIIGDQYYPLHVARLRHFGGTSGHWSGWCRALDEVDFEPRKGVPNSGWPIGKKDLQPYEAAAAGILKVRRSAPNRAVTPDLDEIEIVLSPPVRFGTEYRSTVEQSSSIGLLLNTTVKELVPGEGRIDALKIIDADRKEHDLRVQQVAVCTGGIENSRLLLWSNARYGGRVVPQPLALGRYWMEHPSLSVADVVLFDEAVRQFEKRRFFAPSAAALKAREMGAARIWMPWVTRDSSLTKELVRQALCVAPDLFGRMLSAAGQELRCGAWLRMEFEQMPLAQNRIELDRTQADANGVPRLQLHWTKTAAERKTVLAAARLFGESLIQQNLGRVRLRDWLLTEAWPATEEHGAFHHMGGTRMAASPAHGVVDRDCKVFGVSNLYVGGSSVFPTGGHANPTFSVVQLALRMGDHLAGAVART